MYLNKILSTSFTPEVRKEQFKMLKENLQSRCHMDYDAFEVIYEGYYFISRPTDQDKEILELLSQYKEYVDSLIELDYAIEVEWKDNATIVANELAECKAVKRDSSLLNKGWFSPEESIMDGCRTLNKKWRNKGMCLAIMDIGSDSYVMFPCKETVLQDLKKWAKEIDCMITHSGEM